MAIGGSPPGERERPECSDRTKLYQALPSLGEEGAGQVWLPWGCDRTARDRSHRARSCLPAGGRAPRRPDSQRGTGTGGAAARRAGSGQLLRGGLRHDPARYIPAAPAGPHPHRARARYFRGQAQHPATGQQGRLTRADRGLQPVLPTGEAPQLHPASSGQTDSLLNDQLRLLVRRRHVGARRYVHGESMVPRGRPFIEVRSGARRRGAGRLLRRPCGTALQRDTGVGISSETIPCVDRVTVALTSVPGCHPLLFRLRSGSGSPWRCTSSASGCTTLGCAGATQTRPTRISRRCCRHGASHGRVPRMVTRLAGLPAGSHKRSLGQAGRAAACWRW